MPEAGGRWRGRGVVAVEGGGEGGAGGGGGGGERLALPASDLLDGVGRNQPSLLPAAQLQK